MRKLPLLIFVILFLLQVTAGLAQGQDIEVQKFKINSTNPQSLKSVVKSVNSKKGKVFYDPNTHSLIVTDTKDVLEHIAAIIKQIDKQPKMVSIEVLVAEVSSQTFKDMGFKGTQIIIPQDKFRTLLRLLDSDQNTRTRSRSMIRTLDNQPARIQATREVVVGQTRIMTGDTRFSTPIRRPIGNTLEVRPLINSDNTIKVNIKPSMSTFDAETNTPTQRTLSTQVIINSGDTIALGGLETSLQTETKQSTLWGLPLSKETAQNPSELVVFLTVSIVE